MALPDFRSAALCRYRRSNTRQSGALCSGALQLESQSSEILDKKDIFWGANLFHIGVIFLFCGHCFGLFTPTEWLNAAGLTPRLHQMMEIICGGLSAIVAITGLIILTWRRLTNERVRAASRPSDFWVLFLLLAVIILGIGCVVNSYLYDKSGATNHSVRRMGSRSLLL